MPGRMVNVTPQNSACRMIRVTANSEPLSRTNTSQSPSRVWVATASQLSLGSVGSSESAQSLSMWILPSSGRPRGMWSRAPLR
ncbi:hypothetical protein D3C81_1783570 [compost metagenome]